MQRKKERKSLDRDGRWREREDEGEEEEKKGEGSAELLTRSTPRLVGSGTAGLLPSWTFFSKSPLVFYRNVFRDQPESPTRRALHDRTHETKTDQNKRTRLSHQDVHPHTPRGKEEDLPFLSS